MDMKDLQYKAIYTNNGKNEQTINCDSFGAGIELLFSIIDENGTAVNLSSPDVTTNMKIYIGTHSALKVNGGTVTAVTAASGLVKFTLAAATFLEADAGTYIVELQFCNNATPATGDYILKAGNCYLTVLDSING